MKINGEQFEGPATINIKGKECEIVSLENFGDGTMEIELVDGRKYRFYGCYPMSISYAGGDTVLAENIDITFESINPEE